MSIQSLYDRFEAMEQAKDPEDLRREIEKFVEEVGFEKFAYVLTISGPTLKTQRFIINGFPPEWAERYIAEGFFKVDPVIRHLESSSVPMIWGDDILRENRTPEFWEEARRFGLCDGLSFGIQEQLGVKGVFSLARDQLIDMKGKDLAALVGQSQVFACLLHHAVTRIALPKLLPEQQAPLTPRELECLRLAADGKTAWEVGRILSIAERTAVFHLQNAVQKLGVTNRTQAIVRAVALKLI